MRPIDADEHEFRTTAVDCPGPVMPPNRSGWFLIATHTEDLHAWSFLWARCRKPLPDMLGCATMTGKG